MDFSYFHIPTKIIQGYESFARLNQLGEISRRRIILVTDDVFGHTGPAQNLRRYIENASYGLIPFEVPERPTSAHLKEGVTLVKESHAQTVIGFGNGDILSFARGMAQMASGHDVNYIEIPTLPGIYSGLMSYYFITEDYDLIKRPYVSADFRASWLLLDSSYIEHMPVGKVLTGGFQSLAYALDAYLSRKLGFLGESYALRAIEILAKAGGRLINEPVNTHLKTEMLTGSLLASFAVECSQLGISAALGMGLESAAVCSEAEGASALFTQSLEYLLPQSIDKLQKVALILDINPQKDILETSFSVLEFLQNLHKHMELPSLQSMNVSNFQMENSARVAGRYDFLGSTPRPAGYTEMMDMLRSAAIEKTPSEAAVST